MLRYKYPNSYFQLGWNYGYDYIKTGIKSEIGLLFINSWDEYDFIAGGISALYVSNLPATWLQ